VSTAHLFFEAVDTAVVLARAMVGWLIFLAVVGSVLILAAIATGATAVRAVWRAVRARWRRGRGCAPAGAPHAASGDSHTAGDASSPSRGRTRLRPSWADKQTHDNEWDEAA
jgi:hypothetical protein